MYKIVYIKEENDKVNITKKELQELIDEAYEQGKRDSYWFGDTITTDHTMSINSNKNTSFLKSSDLKQILYNYYV